MSVTVNTYIMYGVLINKPKKLTALQLEKLGPYLDNPHSDKVNPTQNTTVLLDTDYIAIGCVTHKTDVYSHFDNPAQLKFPIDYNPSGIRQVLVILEYNVEVHVEWLVISHYR